MVSIRENAQKFTYIARLYPEHKLSQLVLLMEMPAIDINAAIWYAEDQGWLKIDGDNHPEVTAPEVWEWTEHIVKLREEILFCFKKLAFKEQDLDDFSYGTWVAGYTAHDATIALESLIEEGLMAKYLITDLGPDNAPSEYTFYCLPENLGKEWGRKNFKDQKKVTVKNDTGQTVH